VAGSCLLLLLLVLVRGFSLTRGFRHCGGHPTIHLGPFGKTARRTARKKL
jgi:hypothetical protein